MTLWSAIVGVTFAVIGGLCVILVAIGLPGAWIMLGIAVITDLLLAPSVGSGQTFFGWTAIGTCAGVAVLGEVVELWAAAEGARRGGASARGAVGALVGGLVGGIAGTLLIPIPLVGSLAGAALGALGGAVIGELTREGVTLRDTAKPATGAAIGKVLGILAKIPCAAVIWVVLSIAAILN